MRTVRRSLPLILLLSTLLAGCSLSLPGTRATPTASPGSRLSPAWAAVLNQLGPHGEISLATALQAYTLVFGPLPGVRSPANPGGLIPSGTLALRMMLQHYQDLTPAQQQAVLQRLSFAGPQLAQAAPSVARVVTLAQAQPVAAAAAAPGAPTPVPTDEPGTSNYRAFVNEFIPKLNSFLSFTFTEPIVLAFDPKTTAGAYAMPLDANNGSSGPPVLCRIYLNPILNSYAVDDQRLYMGHELMHCYEAAIQGSIAVFGPSPAWLIEGAAEWAGALVAGSTADTISLQASWVGWLVNPTFPLFQRAYSALGFYALLDHAGISPWSVLPAMLTSQSNGPNNLAAYQAGTQPAPQEVLDEWASSYERDTSLGLDWDLTGPGIIPANIYGGPKAQSLALGDGQSSSVSAPAYAATDAHLTSQAEVVEVTISGTSRLIDSANLERITSADGAYCTKQGGCTCPQGSAYQGLPLTQLTGLVHLALTGGPGGATGSVSGLTLQQFCNQKKKPTSPPQVTQQWCESVMTVADANQIMHPPTPATTIFVQADAELGVCSYISSQTQPAIVKILVEETPYSGPNPVPQATISQLVAQLENDPGATVTTQTPVSGVGDQAEFLAATDAQNALTLYVDVIYVLYGNVAFLCDDFHFNVKPDDAAQLSALQQCAQRVVARLDP